MESEEKTQDFVMRGEDLTGTTCHYLKVIGRAERPPDAKAKVVRGTWWRCVCVCGKERIVPRQYLVTKSINSCGCKNKTPKVAKPKKGQKQSEAINITGFGRVCKCKRCRKNFEKPYAEWGYTIGNELFCTYKCMREEEKERRNKKNGK